MALIRRNPGKGAINWQAVSSDWKIWSVGEERFKSDAPHLVRSPTMHVRSLRPCLSFEKAITCFRRASGEKPTDLSSKVKSQIDVRMLRILRALARLRGEDTSQVELKPWVFHDLRRTMRTHLSALKIPDHIAEMTIGHGRQGLQRVYDQHRYIAEMREALVLWAARLRGIIEPSPANVVQFEFEAARA